MNKRNQWSEDYIEERQILAKVRIFLLDTSERFISGKTYPKLTKERAGFYIDRLTTIRIKDEYLKYKRERKIVTVERVCHIRAKVFKNEVCKGHDLKTVIKALESEGWLTPTETGKVIHRFPKYGNERFYLVSYYL